MWKSNRFGSIDIDILITWNVEAKNPKFPFKIFSVSAIENYTILSFN